MHIDWLVFIIMLAGIACIYPVLALVVWISDHASDTVKVVLVVLFVIAWALFMAVMPS